MKDNILNIEYEKILDRGLRYRRDIDRIAIRVERPF